VPPFASTTQVGLIQVLGRIKIGPQFFVGHQMDFANNRKAVALFQVPLQVVGSWIGLTYGYAHESNHIGWIRLTDVLMIIGILLAYLITVAIAAAPPTRRALLMWVALPTYALIGSKLGYIAGGSLFGQPTIGILIGAAIGFVVGNIARSSILAQYRLHEEHAT
jgi:hypothetical protein